MRVVHDLSMEPNPLPGGGVSAPRRTVVPGAAHGGEVEAIIRLSEAIKAVVAHARQLYLISLNAMFSARRAGKQAVGFSAVTTELREFSRRMSERMEGLSELVDFAVRQVSEMQRQRRTHSLAQAAIAAAGGAERDELRAFAAGTNAHMHRHEEAFADLERRLGQHLYAALRLCMVGDNLAVRAKVEATGAEAEAAENLSQVAEEVAVTVACIQQAIQAEFGRLKA